MAAAERATPIGKVATAGGAAPMMAHVMSQTDPGLERAPVLEHGRARLCLQPLEGPPPRWPLFVSAVGAAAAFKAADVHAVGASGLALSRLMLMCMPL